MSKSDMLTTHINRLKEHLKIANIKDNDNVKIKKWDSFGHVRNIDFWTKRAKLQGE